MNPDYAEAHKEILATPVEDLIASAAGFLIATERVLAKYPDSDDAPPELKDFLVEVATITNDLLGE